MAILSVDVQPGDVIGFSDRSSLGRWINYTTLAWPWSGLSHIGIAARHPFRHLLVLFESTTGCQRPCLITGQVVDGVQCQPLDERVGAYERAWVYPLKQPLTPIQADLLTKLCVADCGRPYDYAGAVRSRQLGLGWLVRIMCPKAENLQAYYCSEFVADRLRDFQRLTVENVSHWAPNPLVRELLRQGVVGKRKPLQGVE